MMYLSLIGDTDYILAVALELNFGDMLLDLQRKCAALDPPYRMEAIRLQYPVDRVRLIDNRDDVLVDRKVYADWERGNEDPLHYYGFEVHDYEPKEDFWHETKPYSVTLWFDGYSAGFDATRVELGKGSQTFHGYGFGVNDWLRFLKHPGH